MKHRLIVGLALGAICALAQAQSQYKYVSPDGVVTYSDQPPPATAKKVELKNFAGGGGNVSSLPFELRRVAENFPVVMYTQLPCAECDQGRSLLRNRGIPYSEKTINSDEDMAELRKLSGGATIPFLMIGRQKLRGFSESAWTAALDDSGYPKSNILPRSYQNPPIQSATGASPSDSANATTQ